MAYLYTMFPENRIRELRKAKGLSQTDLGEAVGLHQTQIGKMENGGRNLTFDWARRIAAVLEVKLADLLATPDNPDRLTEDERKLVQNFRAADPAQKQILQRIAEPMPSEDSGRNVA